MKARAPRKEASPSRRAALWVLQQVERRRGEPASLLNDPRHRNLAPADRDLTTEIVYGVLRWRGALDYVIAHHASRPLEDIEATLLHALRIGLYQIGHLERIPERAAVDEAVRLTHAFGAGRGAGLVNAVLRQVLRHPGVPALPRKEDDPLGYLTITLSHPAWLARRYLDRLGLDGAEARCLRQNEPPPVYLRVSRRIGLAEARKALEEEGVLASAVPPVGRCLRVVAGKPRETSLQRRGLVFVQDAGSQLIPYLLRLEPDDRVLDLCAAPGGKATAMSEETPRGRVYALERRHRRSKLLRRLAGELGAENVLVTTADGRRPPIRTRFARILLDAPCTSLGTLRRNPDIKWRVEEKDLATRGELQLALLRAASDLLASGGRLVYATCSTEPEENEQVVERFLSERPEFHALPASLGLPESARALVDATGYLRTLPERDDMDGDFAAVLTRA